jgi:excisionase family DNA binding protein
MAELEHFYTIIEAARELNLSVPAVRSRIQFKTILSIKTPSGKVLIPKEEVTRLQQRSGDPEADVDAEIARLRQKV